MHYSKFRIDPKWAQSVEVVELEDAPVARSFRKNEIGLANNVDSKRGLDLALDHDLTQLNQASSSEIERELATSALMISEPEVFLKFPLSAVLTPNAPGAESEAVLRQVDVVFDHKSQKKQVLASLDAALVDAGVSLGLKDDVLLVSDELFTNSLFNAAYVDLDNSRSGISRKGPDGEKRLEKPARFFMGMAGDFLVIGCEDAYGTLNVKRFFERIRKCYENGADRTINMNESGGAGLGGFLIHQGSTGYYAGVKQEQQTVICCSFPIKGSSRKRREAPKSIHYFHIKPDGE